MWVFLFFRFLTARLCTSHHNGTRLIACAVAFFLSRADDKMASEYNLEGGATLHLVLALRGGVLS